MSNELDLNNIPKHLGVILDGNRRFAKKLMKEPWNGHESGVETVKRFLDWCKEFKIKEITLYVFSIQNFNRPKVEFDFLMKLFKKEFSYYLTEAGFKELEKDKVRINFIGRINLFPKEIYEIMLELQEKTKNFDNYQVNLAIAYGSKEEIIDAVKRLIEDITSNKISKENINEKLFEKYLYMNSNPDMIIRTGGELRTSNFLAWQSAYSEWFFIKKTWPEFTKEDFIKCLKEYSQRNRRFGK